MVKALTSKSGTPIKFVALFLIDESEQEQQQRVVVEEKKTSDATSDVEGEAVDGSSPSSESDAKQEVKRSALLFRVISFSLFCTSSKTYTFAGGI